MRFSGKTIQAVSEVLRESGTPGIAMAVKVNEAPIAVSGWGSLDLAGEIPIQASGRFPLYSVTKMLLATAAMRLVDHGRILLDADVRDVLPDVALPAAITLRQLLNHTAGLPDYGGLARYAADLRADPTSAWTDAMFLEHTLGSGLLYPPGEGWAYSNIGYLLVRRIVERLGGSGSLATALHRLVAGPAGTTELMVATTAGDMRGLVPGYSHQLDEGGELRDVRARYHPSWVAHGLVTATAADTARVVAALFDGGIVSPKLVQEMTRGVPVPGSHPPFRRAGYGLGLMVDLAPNIALVAGHAGGGPGYSTAAFRFDTDDGRRVTCVALANRDAGDIGLQIAFLVGRAALDASI